MDVLIEESVRQDIVKVLSAAEKILTAEGEKDIAELRGLSDHTIHNASVFQDEDSISIAVLIYSLSKVIERQRGRRDYRIQSFIADARRDLESGRIDEYRKAVKRLLKSISLTESRLKLYIEEVIKQAEIKKGSKLYAHGISLARAAEILGISQWELMLYIGKTRLTDIKGGVNVGERLSYARRLFR